mgnify:CR=1 FL=1|jgi:hypothetical protein
MSDDHTTDIVISDEDRMELAPVSTEVLDQPMPLHDGDDMVAALDAYHNLQEKIDLRLPDAIVEISGKKYRKKVYWRTISRAFGLSVNVVEGSEERLWYDGDWGTKVTYRAQAPSGAFADGDGACMVSEKHGKSGTVHNVRSHAHTRAFNRAVSNLVGFGEVSADEMVPNGSGASRTHERFAQTPTQQPPAQSSPQRTSASTDSTSDEPAQPKTVVGEIESIECKSGETNGRAWELFIVKMNDGTSAATFQHDVYEMAASCESRGVTVEMYCTPKPMRQGDKYQNWTLVSLNETRETPSANTDELTADDVPF